MIEWNLAGYNAYGPPVVGQLNDDNGDGAINSQDTPDIVYSLNSGGGLVSVNGKTGLVQWTSNAILMGLLAKPLEMWMEMASQKSLPPMVRAECLDEQSGHSHLVRLC